ncbi:MAG TPA: pyridoxal phosphate-dependent aminotransferase [Anaerolineae bacterium]|nr:pyridoxal phosphate-dependent aminotransferase [Anaerolineae bacterium]
MSPYDFDRIINRRLSDSEKWHYSDPILPMWVADMDFPAPTPVLEAIQRRVEHGVLGYHHESPTLRQAVVDWVAQRYGWAIEPDWIVWFPDVMVGMNLAARALAEPGAGVLLQSPVYRPFFRLAWFGGYQVQDAPLVQGNEGRWELDMAALEEAADAKTKLLLLCNPQNPTGRVFTQSELTALADFCLSRDITILSDEIHADLIYSESKHTPIASLDPDVAAHTITFIAPSKTFNIAGLKTAVSIIPNPDLRKRVQKAARGIIPVINVLGMVAMEAAYREGGPWLDALLTYLQANRDYLLDAIAAGRLPGVRMTRPEGTFLAWLDFRATPWADAPAKHILEQAQVVVNEGTWFGQTGRGFVRLNFGCPRALLEEGIARIERAMKGEG